VEKSVKGSLRKGGRDGLAILLVYARSYRPARTARGFAWVLRGPRGLSAQGWVFEQVPGWILLEPREIRCEYSIGMNKEQKFDTFQVLCLDAAVVLIIAVIAIVSHHGR
jgi:hypothetical protein